MIQEALPLYYHLQDCDMFTLLFPALSFFYLKCTCHKEQCKQPCYGLEKQTTKNL